jgi:holo-[acyl-carrier protein] synthase
MIFGIGIDVVEIGRIAEAIRRHEARFIEKIFCLSEIEYCRAMKAPASHFAARFAAKEAVAKALGTGFSGPVNWKDIEVRRKANGEPFVVLHAGAAELAQRVGIREIFVSMSHSQDYAVAQAVLLKNETH